MNIKSVWIRLYKNWFNREVDFSDVVMPSDYDPEKHFCIIVARGMKMNEVVNGLKKKFSVLLSIDDSDVNIEDNDRVADKDYAIFFHKNVEADEAYKNLSANTLKEQNHKGITLLERLLLEAYYFETTGGHLDIDNWTLCAGSCYFGGNIPRVGWCSGNSKLYVCWNYPDFAFGHLRSRVVVSLQL